MTMSVTAGSVTRTDGSNSYMQFTAPKPACSVGDILGIGILHDPSSTITPPSGSWGTWTLRADVGTASANLRLAYYDHLVTGTEPSSFTWLQSNAFQDPFLGDIVKISGNATSNFVADLQTSSGSGGGTSQAGPAGDVLTVGSLLLTLVAATSFDTETLTAPTSSGYTDLGQFLNFNHNNIGMAGKVITVTGETSPPAFVFGAAPDDWAAITIVYSPVSVSPAGPALAISSSPYVAYGDTFVVSAVATPGSGTIDSTTGYHWSDSFGSTFTNQGHVSASAVSLKDGTNTITCVVTDSNGLTATATCTIISKAGAYVNVGGVLKPVLVDVYLDGVKQ